MNRSEVTTWIRRAALFGFLALACVYVSRGRLLVALAWLTASLVPVIAGQPPGRRRYAALAFAAATPALLTLMFVVGIDLYLHHRFADSGGFNIRGYRGPVAAAKQPGERRLVMLGGSVTFGYGVRANETIPYYLQQQLNSAEPSRYIFLRSSENASRP